ncbi:AAA family ATPase [Mariniblastus sp.]|nr:AAA family ATPase [Mariniblastus sp.]
MRSIAIINQKGGVGKTTTAVNLAAALAEAGNRVWLIDLDPQAHASLHLGFGMEEDYLSMYDVLTDDASLNDVRHQVEDNLWISPAHIDLAAAEMELAGAVGREIILRDKMQDVSDEFDYIIFDCPPSLSVLTLNALTTANEIFLPLQPHFLALHGLSKLLKTIDLVARRLNPNLKLSNVVYCLYDRGTRLANEVINDVEFFLSDQRNAGSVWSDAMSFDTRIRRNIRLAEAPSYGQSIFQYAGDSNGAQDYRSLAMEVMQQTEVTSPEAIVDPQEERFAPPHTSGNHSIAMEVISGQ